MPFMDHWNVSHPHISLRDIIKEEQALHDNMEKVMRILIAVNMNLNIRYRSWTDQDMTKRLRTNVLPTLRNYIFYLCSLDL